ncbi:MAG: CBS domain-containing protein [Steroidobacteraceae bacterium]|nr:CBS domain-containing protein [Steroidobacteraceae bacterium]
MDKIALRPAKIDGEGVLAQRSVNHDRMIGPADPAVLAVTDFAREAPVTVDQERPIDSALEDMVRFGVRALLVMHERRIVGLITSYDIQGERPLQFLQNSNYEHHRDIRVGHIMTPWSELPALEWSELQAAHAGELLGMLRHEALTHVLVIERGADRTVIVRGLISRARLQRQLRTSTDGIRPPVHAA